MRSVIVFGLLMAALGAFLLLRPQVWHRLSAPVEEKERAPSGQALRAIRLRGLTFLLGGLALLVLQLVRR